MSLIPFPDVPNVPGVPALPRSPNFPPAARVGLGLAQGLLWRVLQVETRWGIFDSAGNPLGDTSKFTGLTNSALSAAGLGSTLSTGSVDYSKEMKVSDFPVEKGSFASYNKVETPATPALVLCFSGSENDRRNFLDAIDKATKSTNFYSVVTPEVTYVNYSIESYDYSRRAERGATLLMVQLRLKEIREVSAQYSQSNPSQVNQPQDVGATSTVDTGKVQAQTPIASTLKSLINKLPQLF